MLDMNMSFEVELISPIGVITGGGAPQCVKKYSGVIYRGKL